MQIHRRSFVKFLGLTGLAATSSGSIFARTKRTFTFTPLGKHTDDSVKTAEGLVASILLRTGDPISSSGDVLGTNCDFIAFLPGDFLWVNHEYPDLLYLHGVRDPRKKTKRQIAIERKAVGGSFIRIERGPKKQWRLSPKTLRNFRLDGETKIPFFPEAEILKSSAAEGTLANCSGGQTPWGSILSCEENFHDFYGTVVFDPSLNRSVRSAETKFGWAQFHPLPPEHYGWVLEIDPETKSAKKLTSLGRFAHEGALCLHTKYERCVVYMGDDAPSECLYKFIGSEKNSLLEGKLYVADTARGVWKSIAFEDNPSFKEKFGTKLNTLIRTREAAHFVGGSLLPRPEGIAQDPLSKDLFVALTGDATSPYGSILKIKEKNGDPLSLDFKAETFIAGSQANGFAAPDNIVFDKNGNLWMCVDYGGNEFGNNSLYVIPRTGKKAGQALKIASAPIGAEFTGPCFTPDGKTLFLSVQHPGAGSKSRESLTSHWPDGNLPRSAVIALEGPLLEMFTV